MYGIIIYIISNVILAQGLTYKSMEESPEIDYTKIVNWSSTKSPLQQEVLELLDTQMQKSGSHPYLIPHAKITQILKKPQHKSWNYNTFTQKM